MLLGISTFLTLTTFAHGQEKIVDQFQLKKDSIKVIFYDPLLTLEAKPDFKSKSEKDKSDLIDSYLHNNPLYLFKVITAKTKDITYLCIRGNPDKVNTKMFYKVEIIKGITDSTFNPNTSNYSDKIVKIIDNVNCGGTLFENMEMFTDPKNKKYIGNGILFMGYFCRVQPYAEIKLSMTDIIEQL